MGSLRCGQLIRHLGAFGWDVTVLTAEFPPADRAAVPPSYVQTPMMYVKDAVKRALGIRGRSTHAVLGARVHSATESQSPVNRVLNFANAACSYPDPQIGWLPFGIAAAKRTVRHGEFDAVISSSNPVTAHFIAAAAHGRLPWIADLRDLWSDNHYHVTTRSREFVDRFLERRTFNSASALVTVSEPLANILRDRYPRKPVFTIPNGFDEAEWAEIPFGRETKCTLLYPGTLYGGWCDPSPLFAAIANLKRVGKISAERFAVQFFSPEADWLRQYVEQFGISDIVTLNERVDRRSILFAQRRADALLLFLRDHPSYAGVYTGKLFEYLGARRPIVVVGGPQTTVVDDVLRETDAGSRCRTPAELESRIAQIVEAHEAGRNIDVPSANAASHTSISMAQRFASVLASVT